MKDEDLLRCPLLRELDSMHRAQLIGLLNDSHVRESLEECLASHMPESEKAAVVRIGKPELTWRRSSKE